MINHLYVPRSRQRRVDVFHYIDGGACAEQEALRAVIEGSGVPTEIVAG